jgi:hypothetical protein
MAASPQPAGGTAEGRLVTLTNDLEQEAAAGTQSAFGKSGSHSMQEGLWREVYWHHGRRANRAIEPSCLWRLHLMITGISEGVVCHDDVPGGLFRGESLVEVH